MKTKKNKELEQLEIDYEKAQKLIEEQRKIFTDKIYELQKQKEYLNVLEDALDNIVEEKKEEITKSEALRLLNENE